MNFECVVNDNGSCGLFNHEIGDIYFSNIGAYTEAMQKFVLPSYVNEFNHDEIKVLDVCYGLGYNSKSLVDFCIKNNFNFDFKIDCIEIDKNILSLGLLFFDENILDEVNLIFGKQILEQINLEENIIKILGENGIKNFLCNFKSNFYSFCDKNRVLLYKNDKIINVLHNIYYQNQINYINNGRKLKVKLILNDLVKILPNLSYGYDLIFHDAFSILKQPDLWSENIFRRYYELLNPAGKVLTYSNSRVLRRILENIGFKVEINFLDNGKQNGTIGIKS